MAPMYYRNANIALIIFDLTQYESFDSVKTWVKGLFVLYTITSLVYIYIIYI